MESLFSNVLAYGLSPSWWELRKEDRASMLSEVRSALTELKKDSIKADLYESLRYDCNIIIWLLTKDPKDLGMLKSRIQKILGNHAKARYGFLSIYEPRGKNSSDGREFFVAYPVTKSPEWYLLDKDKRAEIMKGHIDMAKSDPANTRINSYTTQSFGIDDFEFVVIYELDSLQDWVAVTQNLRGADAHRWVINEKPILVGRRSGFESLLL